MCPILVGSVDSLEDIKKTFSSAFIVVPYFKWKTWNSNLERIRV